LWGGGALRQLNFDMFVVRRSGVCIMTVAPCFWEILYITDSQCPLSN